MRFDHWSWLMRLRCFFSISFIWIGSNVISYLRSCDFYAILCDVCCHILSFSLHDLFNIDIFVLKPAEIVGDQVQWVTILAPYKNNPLLIWVLGESSSLFVLTLTTRIRHQQQPILATSRAFDLVLVKSIVSICLLCINWFWVWRIFIRARADRFRRGWRWRKFEQGGLTEA